MKTSRPATGAYVPKTFVCVCGALFTLCVAQLAGAVTPVNDDFINRATLFDSNGPMEDLSVLAAPTNDLFAFRTSLSGLPVEVSGNNELATTDTNNSPRSIYIPGASVWFEWIAPKTTRASIWIDAEWQTPHVTAFTGDSFAALKPIGRLGRRDAPLTFFARQGRKYIIAVGSAFETGPFTLRILPPPANDLFDSAGELTGIYARAESYTSGASVEAREPRLDPSATRESIWWKWHAPLSGLAIVRMDGNYSPRFTIFEGNRLASLRPVPILSVSGNVGYMTAAFNAASGTVYRIAAAGHRFFDGAEHHAVNGRVSIEVAVSTLQIVSPPSGSVFSPGAVIAGNVQAALPETTPPLIDIAAYTATGQEVARASALAPNYEFTFANLPIGRLYVIAAGPGTTPPPIFSPALPIRVPPVNDDFEQKTIIPRLPALLSGSLAGSSLESAEPSAPVASAGSVWWTWTAPSNRIVRLVTQRSMDIFRGQSLSSLRLVKTIAGEGTFSVNAGHTYHFRSTGAEWQDCYASLGWLAVNDKFANRVKLAGTNVVIEANNSGATLEPDEPTPGRWGGGASLWWSWTAPMNGTLLLRRSNIVTSLVAVFRGAKLTELERLYPDDLENSPVVQVAVQAGVSYQIALHSTAPTHVKPPVTMQLDFVADSPNDHFANALPLTGTQILFGGANYNATREAGEPIRIVYGIRPYGQHPVNATLWWRWTAPANGIVTISTVPGDFHPFVEMFEGNDLLSLQSLIPANLTYFSIPSSIDFQVESGHQYQISAGGINNARGVFQLQLQAP